MNFNLRECGRKEKKSCRKKDLGKALGERSGRSRTLVRTPPRRHAACRGGACPRLQGTDAHICLHQGYFIPTQPSCRCSFGAVVREEHVGSGRDGCYSAAGRARTSSGRLPPNARSPSPAPCTVLPPLPGCFQGWRLRGLWMCSTSKELLTESSVRVLH